VFVSSRSFDEYCAFFDLTPESLPARVLDCAAGASGFTADARARGSHAVATDLAYGDRAELVRAVEGGFDTGTDMMQAHIERFDWSWYGTPQRRAQLREQARRRFLDDLAIAPQRYLAAALPRLPFHDHAFDLALCSHLIFTWAVDLDEAWHRAALTELLRVATEVRVFPLVHQATGAPIEFLGRLVGELRAGGAEAQIRRVPYVFQRGADTMLVLRHT
jgi:hypothetical protein